MIKPGVYYDLDMEKYHADPALSRSDIVRLNLSPKLYKEYVDKDKPEYRIGRALHGLVLQGIPLTINEKDGRSKAGKAFQADYPDAVTPVMAEMIEGMAEQTRPFFVEGSPEVSFFWERTIGDTSVMCKCRPDWLTFDTIYDFKSTRQTLEGFHWDIRRFSYDVQDVWYTSGVEQHIPISKFQFVVVEKTVPHRVGLFEIADLTRAREMVENGLSVYDTCQKTGVWKMPNMVVRMI